ncbi:conserved exported hypothetical protein [Rubrivivax sp. A210]|uniref:hypothetical protein n=1 Tax=Rubrivivax sp. A210 TaxID=2772301 RepID=UPI00191809A9|nr:hypothetical protein [Rubrivivax sp. A210]CAD5369651.1 conserved exported hypothetical protein [Rubrivivax sp. A210]
MISIRFDARLLTWALVLAGLSTAAQADGVPWPVKVLAGDELAVLSGQQFLTPTNHAFHMAAAVKVAVDGMGLPRQSVKRSLQAPAAVHQALPAATGSPPLLPSPVDGHLYDFQQVGNHAQTWATMTAVGVPHIALRGFGAFDAEATVSWSTTVTLAANGGLREVVVSFVMPPVMVSGNSEADGPAFWRARLHADLLVNGHPAWSTEALRFTADPTLDFESTGSKIVLQQFGDPLGFPSNDEDPPATGNQISNDSDAGSVDGPSSKRTVNLSLGRFAPGTVLDLSLVLRAHALTVPTFAGKTLPRACTQGPDAATGQLRYFCSRGSVAVLGAATESPRIYRLP